MRTLGFNVVVVGAGPAGCAAAIYAATTGLTVGIIERARFPRDLPGEALHPDIDSVLEELGVRDAVTDAGFVKYPGWILENSRESTFVPFGAPLTLRFGYQAWRAELDSILIERARHCGAEVFEETDALELLMSGERVIGVTTSDSQLTAAHVIDASGPRRWLSRRLSISSSQLSPKLVARYGYSKQDFGLGNIPVFRQHANGWTWLAKVREGTCQCVQLALRPDTELPALPAHFGFPSKLRGADVTWRLVDLCAGPGYFICGDAAAVLDPAASRGVARALESGLEAAKLLGRVNAGEVDDADATLTYRRWLADKIRAEATQLAMRHAVLEDSPSWVHDFGDRFREVPGVAI